jgi:transposase
MDTPNNLYLERGGVCMGEKNRHFTAEFKRNAVQLVTEKGMPVGKAARELDIHPNQLHLWRRQFLKEGDKAFVGKAHAKPELAEVTRLNKELKRVKEELEILKKAQAFFSKKNK